VLAIPHVLIIHTRGAPRRMAVGQVALERFVKCVLWRCSLYVFVLPGYAQHILIISFGRVKFSSRLWHNSEIAHTPFDRARCRIVKIVWRQFQFVLHA
jgi:hypothetical protein